MAKGDPLRAQEIFENLTPEWYDRWHAWRKEKITAKIPDVIIGTYKSDDSH